ncbi:MAG: hypothetical protein SFW67_35110 [Myxococcaceae bacterium]|nr:hypothetical protein [Myxococcaceae bacterium]
MHSSTFSMWLAALVVAQGAVAAEPLVLPTAVDEPNFTGAFVASRGELLVAFDGYGEWGGARRAALWVKGRWLRVPAGPAFEAGAWLVFDGLEPLPATSGEEREAPPVGAKAFRFGTDDVFIRRAVVVNRETGLTFEAPVNTAWATPGARGQWSVIWCGPEGAVAGWWNPRSGQTRRLGPVTAGCDRWAMEGPPSMPRPQLKPLRRLVGGDGEQVLVNGRPAFFAIPAAAAGRPGEVGPIDPHGDLTSGVVVTTQFVLSRNGVFQLPPRATVEVTPFQPSRDQAPAPTPDGGLR